MAKDKTASGGNLKMATVCISSLPLCLKEAGQARQWVQVQKGLKEATKKLAWDASSFSISFLFLFPSILACLQVGEKKFDEKEIPKKFVFIMYILWFVIADKNFLFLNCFST